MYLFGAIADYILTAILDELACRELEQAKTVPNIGPDRQKRKWGGGGGGGVGEGKKEGGEMGRGREKYPLFLPCSCTYYCVFFN